MAKFISPVWSSASGSIAGTTFQSGPAGKNIARSKPSGASSGTPVQQHNRNGMAFAAAAWNSLTQSDRLAWDNYSMYVYVVPGRAMFIGIFSFHHMLKSRFGQSLQDNFTPPETISYLRFEQGPFTLFSVPGQAGVRFQFKNMESVNALAYVTLSPRFKPSRNFFENRWDQSKSKVITFSPYQTRLPGYTLPPDGRYWMGLRAITLAPPYRISRLFVCGDISKTTPLPPP